MLITPFFVAAKLEQLTLTLSEVDAWAWPFVECVNKVF